jgi:predicted RNase H-like nuclease (RuvC/YqgF family)
MGYGSAGTPPWVDDQSIDQEKKEKEIVQYIKKIQLLEKENKALKKHIKELEEEVHTLKKTK